MILRIYAVLSVLLLAALSCGGMETVRLGTEGAYPPFAYLNDDRNLEGFEIELGEEMCRRVQLKCQWVVNDWDSIIPNLQDGKYDAIMAAMSITEERDKLVDFTQPYYPPEASRFAALAGADESVTRGRVAVQEATVQSDYLDGRVTELKEYQLAEETIDAVLQGQADSVFAGASYLREIMAESDGRLAYVGSQVVLEKGTGIAVREGDEALLEKLDHAITTMKEDGSLNELITKWFGDEGQTF